MLFLDLEIPDLKAYAFSISFFNCFFLRNSLISAKVVKVLQFMLNLD